MTLPSGRTTNILVGITLLMFLALEASGLVDDAAVIAGFIPARVAGALSSGTEQIPWLPAWLTPMSATLVHGGWLHIGFNMAMLLFCGRQVEHVLGTGPTLVLYTVGAYAAAAAQWAVEPDSGIPMIGASGAVSALMGTYALLYSQRDVRAFGPVPANVVRVLWLAAGWIGLQLLLGLATRTDGAGIGQIAVFAHIGGFIAGLLLLRPLLKWRFRRIAN